MCRGEGKVEVGWRYMWGREGGYGGTGERGREG